MKKLLALAVTLAFCSTAALASHTRVASMGVPSWMILDDDSNIWANPAGVSSYRNNIWLELWDGAGEWGGVAMETELADVGLFLGRPYEGVLDVLSTTGLLTEVPKPMFDLFLSRELENMDIGMRFGMTSLHNSTETAAGDEMYEKASDTLIGLGISAQGVGPLAVLDVAFQMHLLSAEVVNETVVNEIDHSLDAGLTYGFGARGAMPLGGAGFLMGYARIESVDASWEWNMGAASADVDFTMSRLTLGAALNQYLGPKTLMVAGLYLERDASSYEDERTGADLDETETAIPAAIGLETVLSEKLTLRLGANKDLYRVVAADDGASETKEVTTGGAAASVGLGLNLVENLTIDALVEQRLLYDGPDAVGGNAPGMNAQITAKYSF